MAQFLNMYKVELNQGTAPVFSLRQIYYGDVEANRIGAIVLLNGEPVALSGTCSGTAILADGSTVALTGTVDGSQAYVELPAACYSVEGQIQVFVKLTVDGVTTTLIVGVGTVRLTETDTVIDPGTIIPSVAALIDDIDAAVASIPADYTALLAAVAPDYTDLTFPVTAGTWCWYSGILYRAKVDIPASETWTADHWENVILSNALAVDIANIKSQIDAGHVAYFDNTTLSGLSNDLYKLDESVIWEQGSWTASAEVDSDYWIRTPLSQQLAGGFLIHNKNTNYGFFVGKYNANTGEWAGYVVSSLNQSEYYFVPAESGYTYRLRVRLAESSTSILRPSQSPIDIYRSLNIGIMTLPEVRTRANNSPSFVGLTGDDYDNLFANVAGTDNVFTNIARSQWNDVPFGGAGINQRHTTNYDLQIIFALDSKNIAYRFVARSTKVPYNDWQILVNNNLNGKKVAIIGDSRSSYQGTVPSGNAYYYPQSSGAVLTNLSEMWWKKVLDYFSMSLTVNDSYSGGYVANKDGNNGANILSSDTAINKLGTTAPDIIMVFAGVNDWNGNAVNIGDYDGTGEFPSNNATFREALAILISKVQNKFPTADIWLCTNPYCCPAGTESTASNMPVPRSGYGGTSLDKFNNAIIDIGRMFGCGIIDFTRCGTNYKNIVTYTGDYSTDNGLHYNANGNTLLANIAIKTLDDYYNGHDF